LQVFGRGLKINEPQRRRGHRDGKEKVKKFGAASQTNGSYTKLR